MPGFADNEKTARRIAATMVDPRVRHFYDPFPIHRAGKAFATGHVHAGPAWDIYFFYEKGVTWADAPPQPVEWWHQLGRGDRADPDRFAAGSLAAKLHDSMHSVTGEECQTE